MGADKKRYGKLLDMLQNTFQVGKDEYPESLEATLNLLSNYQDHQVAGGRNGDVSGDYSHGSSFAMKTKQRSSKVHCFSCN